MLTDPLELGRRRAAEEALAAAAVLTDRSADLDAVRTALAAAAAAVRWRSGAADRERMAGDRLVHQLTAAARDCAAAGELLRAAAGGAHVSPTAQVTGFSGAGVRS